MLRPCAVCCVLCAVCCVLCARPHPHPRCMHAAAGPRCVQPGSLRQEAALNHQLVACGAGLAACRVFTNPRTKKTARVKGVLHFAESGARYLYIWPVGTAAQFNSVWSVVANRSSNVCSPGHRGLCRAHARPRSPALRTVRVRRSTPHQRGLAAAHPRCVWSLDRSAGDTLAVTRYYDPGKAAEDNLALSFVHGTDKEYGAGYFKRPSRLRVGHTSQAFEGGRDYTVGPPHAPSRA